MDNELIDKIEKGLIMPDIWELHIFVDTNNEIQTESIKIYK